MLTIVLCAAYMGSVLKRGWYPHDEGTLGQSAERVLYGEIPHKDFDEIYTGGLSYLDAAAFRLLGTNLVTPRYVSFAVFLVWVPALLYIALQFMSVPVACAITLLAVAFGYPNYPAAMPSWYNLFLATFGLAALLHHVNVGKSRWLLLAGVLGGCSVLIKISGLFYISAVLLWLLYRNQLDTRSPENQKLSPIYRAFVFLSALCYVAVLLALLRLGLNVVTFGYLFMPGFAIAVFLVCDALQNPDLCKSRFLTLFGEGGWFLIGVLLPVLPYIAFYARQESIRALYRGVFVLPQQRFSHQAALTPAPSKFLVGLAMDALVVACLLLPSSAFARRLRFITVAAIASILVLCVRSSNAKEALWRILWSLAPVVVIGGLLLLVLNRVPALTQASARQKLFAVLAVTAGCSLIQYPYFGHIYFCYVAPLVVLSCAAVVSFLRNPPRRFLVSFALIAAAYAIFVVTPGLLRAMGSRYFPDVELRELKLVRAGGLRVATGSAATYEPLVKVIADHARGNYIYATPDCPEVYFLAGFRNPTRTLFDFFDEPRDRISRILDLIHGKQVNLVVLNQLPEFSDRVPAPLQEELEREFPEHQSVGRFDVRWKP
jgi:hypothetical protein